jgi:hypothetical protein
VDDDDDDDEPGKVVTAAVEIDHQKDSGDTTRVHRTTDDRVAPPVPTCGDVVLPEAAKAYVQVLGQLIP